MIAKNIITTLTFLTIFYWPISVFAETTTFKTSYDCTKVTIAVEQTICGVQVLADADTELGLLYKNLLHQLPETEQAVLKKEQLEWLTTRNKSCVNQKDDIECIQKLYFERVEALKNLSISTSTGTATKGRTITFKPTDKSFTEFSKGQVDIDVKRYIEFDTTVNLSTATLKGQLKNEQPFSVKFLNDQLPNHVFNARSSDTLINVEVLIARADYDKEWKNVEGYYFVLYLSRWSTAKNGRGYCGSGVENELIVLLTDKVGRLISNDIHLVSSCLKNVGSLFIRDSTPEMKIYVIYSDSDTHTDPTTYYYNLLRIDYLYPRRGVEAIKGKKVPFRD